MIRLNKLTLFILMFVTATSAGIAFSLVEWETVLSGKNILRELQLPVLLLVLCFYFMVPYVKRIKEEKNERSKD